MKLWKKNTDSDSLVHQFTVGKDREFDLLLARHDVIGSIAHVNMLASVKLITDHEAELLVSELRSILGSIESGQFRIEENCEDVHSQIEMLLTKRLGNTGKKVHTARSRNDQSLLDIKLFIREELERLSQQTILLAGTLLHLAEEHKDTLFPGYTHYQLAMPSSFGLWFGAYAESLADDLELLKAAYNVADRNPLGSAAGYGSSFPIDREFTTRELHFSGMNVSSVYAQMTRGKTEKFAATALAAIAATLGKLSADITLYMNQEFSYISMAENMTTGSSIMPHKKNPDPWELIRAKSNRIQSLPNELSLLLINLPSGYHRDYQLTKEILFPGIETLHDMVELSDYLLRNVQVRKDILSDRKYDTLFTVDAINQLVQAGIPFREAYQMIGREVDAGTFTRPTDAVHTHIGSLGNPGLELIRNRIESFSLKPQMATSERTETSTH